MFDEVEGQVLLADPEVEAVALFTPAPDHARHAA